MYMTSDARHNMIENLCGLIAKRKQPNQPLIVGITGVDNAGKTHLVGEVEPALRRHQLQPQVVHVDDFHNPKAVRYADDLPEPQAYYERSIDFDRLVRDVLVSIKRDGHLDVTLNLLDLPSDTWSLERQYRVTPDTVVLLEGVFLFRPETCPYIDLFVFLDVREEVVIQRARMRDLPTQGEEVMRKYNTKYLPAQREYLKQNRPEEFADVYIDNTDWQNPVLVVEPKGFQLENAGQTKRYDAVVFDLWKTLVPLEDDVKKQAFQETAQALNLDPEQLKEPWAKTRIRRETGDLEEYFHWLRDELGADWSDETISTAMQVRRRIHGAAFQTPDPHAVEVLRSLREQGMPIALVSNCSSDVRDMIASSELAPWFNELVLSSEVGIMKPNLQVFALAADKLGVSPDRCLYVGDGHDNELVGATEAGMHAALIDRGEGREWEKRFSTLLEVLQEVGIK